MAPTAPLADLDLSHALIQQGDDVFALAVAESSDHSGYLARWHAVDLAAGNLDAVEWWNGSSYAAGATPARVLDDAGPECSIHFDARLNKLVLVRSDGFGATTIVVSFADRLEGPWSQARSVFRPPEDNRDQPFVYAAKGHPELTGGDLIVTYATNTLGDFTTLVNDTTLYYPRFVKLSLAP